MEECIVVAGANGALGSLIVNELLQKGAPVKALIRKGSNLSTPNHAASKVEYVDYTDKGSLVKALDKASCVVSALSGLDDVIVGSQLRLLDAAIDASVPRFIPSDFAIDFKQIPANSNRNLQLRKDFLALSERAPIRFTSVLNGAFMDMLTGQIPIIRHQLRRVLYWGSADQPMDFTTMANTAAFTADAALDADAPRWLRISGERASVRDLARIAGTLKGKKYSVLCAGTLSSLSLTIRIARTVSPGRSQLYPAWQGMQYMRNMFAGQGLLDLPLDNTRYGPRKFTSIREALCGSKSN